MEILLNCLSSAIIIFIIILLIKKSWNELILQKSVSTVPLTNTTKANSILIFFISILILWFSCLLGHLIAGYSFSDFFNRFLERFTGEGDAPRYIFMAENGYVREGEYVNNIVFYPLYPFLMKIVSIIFNINTEYSGILISQIFFGLSCVYLVKLAELENLNKCLCLISFIFYPFSFFALGVFSESLFIFLCIFFFYSLKKRNFPLCGLLSFLAALTRLQGILLSIPFIYIVIREKRNKIKDPKQLFSISSFLGFGIYLLINKIYCGSFFAFRTYEASPPWWQTTQWIGKTIAQQWERAFYYAGIAKWIYWPQLILFFITAAIIILGILNNIRLIYPLHATAYLIISYSASWLISGGRYMFSCIPVYLILGSCHRKYLSLLFILIELFFSILFNTYFMQGQCIM